MKYELEQLIIKRNDTPNNSSTNGRINSITKKRIGAFFTQVPVQAGEILRYEDKDYNVIKIIRVLGFIGEKITLEVKPYSTMHFNHASESWSDNIPLCIDVEEETNES